MTEKKLYDCGVEDCGYCRATDITDDGYVWHDKRLKPCPFCGILGVAFCEGRPPRWREMYCVFCYDAPDGTAEEKALDLFERGLEMNTRAKK